MRKCRRQPRAGSRHCECPSRRQVQMRALLQHALRVPVPSPKCRCAEFRRERRFQVQMSATSCSRHCASGRPVPKCRMRALLQQAALRVAVPSPSADVQNSCARADVSHELQQALASGRPVPSPSADARAACSRHCECQPNLPQVQMCKNSAASAAAAGSIASGRPRPQVQIFSHEALLQRRMTGSAAWQWQVQISATSAAAAAV
ncbi:hypothetical protein OPV22_034715 [Ensete ventricosum]|uniref:Bifunctional inhibitor/plant lipid transfer protein/seed storage helical domain-containing protein n=1 Tax=Ensete ventricosum TaxID=4639 RepID=A0AAV8PSE5_ENSVE|nr:hypothetical protein OPV22_034715 [Ensete ventricosum]